MVSEVYIYPMLLIPDVQDKALYNDGGRREGKKGHFETDFPSLKQQNLRSTLDP